MGTMTLRGIDDDTSKALKDRAKKEGTSVNALSVKILRETLGVEKKKRSAIYSDLDQLAGTWTAGEAAEFKEATAMFEEIDEDMWRKDPYK